MMLTAQQQQLLSELESLRTRIAVQIASMELIDGIQDGCWFSMGREQMQRGLMFVERAVRRLTVVDEQRRAA